MHSLVGTNMALSCYREEAQETVSLLEDNVKDVESERDELKTKLEALAASAEERLNVSCLFIDSFRVNGYPSSLL